MASASTMSDPLVEIQYGALFSLMPALSTMAFSSAVRLPRMILLHGTPERIDRFLNVIVRSSISNENHSTGMPISTDCDMAKFSQICVLPTLWLAATTVNVLGRIPIVAASRRLNPSPNEIPIIWSGCSICSWIQSMALLT